MEQKRKIMQVVKAKPNCKNCLSNGYLKSYASPASQMQIIPCSCIVRKYKALAEKYGRENVEVEPGVEKNAQQFVINIYESETKS